MDTLSYHEQLLDERWAEKRRVILKRDGHCCRMCSSKGEKDLPLEIHHRYYIYGAMAWEYNDQALITLCHDCHELVHLTLSPLIYFNNGTDLVRMNFTPCHRCNGAGWFREYNHIQGGVCFRCNGQRYEELIDQKHINHMDYISQKDEIFDLLEPNVDDKTNEEIFNEANGHYFGLHGDDSDWDMAKQLYHTAAMNGYAKAQNNYATHLSIIAPGNGLTILRYYLYSAMQGIYQAQSAISDILKTDVSYHDKVVLSKRWRKLATDNEKRRYKQLGQSLFECSSDDEINAFYEQLSFREKDIIRKFLEEMSKTGQSETDNDNLPLS